MAVKKTKIKPQCGCNTKDITLYILSAPIGEKGSYPLRPPVKLQERLETLKKRHDVKSMNQLIVGLLEKSCDEQGV